ncbi:glycosyl transferase family 2 [Dysgonomonas alginatilytica]|uniref:Glycosyl transferase family 2 n=1 Tax=Dysgonomonas alginatilytica TaxID=1605892 RepID=A0A2V3PL75_9BACT|nr:glycosyltransferase family A protein [Dysgonomonas alginatilytica]PXV62513.1 glycosyl transferase family 2 [Dysgonomonas alginatilytica]
MKVSVLIPMYNAEIYISATIENVLKQTWSDLEVIIVDDGSTDNSYALAKKYESENVHIYRQDNKGASAARNLALEKSTGELIQYLDADDLLSFNKIEAQVKLYTKINDKNAIIASGILLFDGDVMETICIPHRQMSTNSYNKPVDLLIDICREKYIVQSSIWLMHRDLLTKVGGWNEQLTLNDDGEYFFRVVGQSSGVYFCSEGAVFYRNTPQSLSKQVSQKAIESQLLATQVMTQVVIRLENSKRVRAACVNFYMQYITRFHSDYYNERAAIEIKRLGFDINTFKKDTLYKIAYLILGQKLIKKLSEIYHKK